MRLVYLILFITFLVLNILLVFKIIALNDSLKTAKEISATEKDTYFDLVLNQSMNTPLFALKVSDSTQILTESSGIVSPKELFKGYSRVFLKVSQYNCFSCIESEFRVLNSFENSGLEIMIIAQYNSVKEASVLRQKTNLKFPIFVIHEPLPLESLERHNVPYYFSIDSSSNVTSFFIPHKRHPTLSNKYLRSSLASYSNKSSER